MTYDYERFKLKVLELTGIDLNAYKERQMKRRIDTLIQKSGFDGYEFFYKEILQNPILRQKFVNYLTINVSEFYRNPTQWQIVSQKIYPELLKHKGTRLKIWSAACSTGDEPYTLAMLLADFIPLEQIQIVATDLDDKVLEYAKIGRYQSRNLKNLPEKYLKQYFTRKELDEYVINDEIRACVEFHQHNLLSDTYYRDMDLIVCRNVLIYFTEEAKTDIYRKFNQALKTDGILFIGSTEQIIQPRNLNFEPYDSFFYQKR